MTAIRSIHVRESSFDRRKARSSKRSNEKQLLHTIEFNWIKVRSQLKYPYSQPKRMTFISFKTRSNPINVRMPSAVIGNICFAKGVVDSSVSVLHDRCCHCKFNLVHKCAVSTNVLCHLLIINWHQWRDTITEWDDRWLCKEKCQLVSHDAEDEYTVDYLPTHNNCDMRMYDRTIADEVIILIIWISS